MHWVNNNLIDDKNENLVGCNEGSDCWDQTEIRIYDNNNNDITDEDLTDWEFAEITDLDENREDCEEKIVIVSRKLNVTGTV